MDAEVEVVFFKTPHLIDVGFFLFYEGNGCWTALQDR
jgi:hypothetical protein